MKFIFFMFCCIVSLVAGAIEIAELNTKDTLFANLVSDNLGNGTDCPYPQVYWKSKNKCADPSLLRVQSEEP